MSWIESAEAPGPDSRPGQSAIAKPVVSVVIPVHNRADLIGRAVSSVISQTFDKWELIVVDDGSDEDVLSVLTRFTDPRISVVRLDKNSGAPVARNTGVRRARGDFVGFLDSDDEWLPNKLEVQLRAMDSQIDVVLCGFLDELDGRAVELRPSVGLLKREGLLWGPRRWITTGQFLVRASNFDEIRFDETLEAYQDWDLLMQLGRANNILGIPDVLMIKHEHDGGRIYSGFRRHRALLAVSDKYSEDIAQYPEIDRRWRRRKALAHWQLGDFHAMCEVLDEALADHPGDGEIQRLRRFARTGPRLFTLFMRMRNALRRFRRGVRHRRSDRVDLSSD